MNLFSIWKFPVKIDDEVNVTMPADAKIIKIGMQGAFLCFWAQIGVNENGQPLHVSKIKKYLIVGTGMIYDKGQSLRHVETVFQDNGFVWHIFTYKKDA